MRVRGASIRASEGAGAKQQRHRSDATTGIICGTRSHNRSQGSFTSKLRPRKAGKRNYLQKHKTPWLQQVKDVGPQTASCSKP